jgi:hypothetical protein
LRGANIANSADIGLIKGYDVVFMDVISYSGNTSGVTYENINTLLLINLAWFENNSNTFETLVGTFTTVEKVGGFSTPTAANGATAFDVSGISSITNGEVKTITVGGDGTRVTGSFSKEWEVDASGIDTEKDDVAAGNIYMTTPTLTAISAVNTPIKVAGTTASSYLLRTSSSVNNRIVYEGTKTRRFNVTWLYSCGLLQITKSTPFTFT